MTRMNPPYVMNSSRFVSRGTKTRLIAYFCFALVMCAVVYVFHGTQFRLREAIRESNDCVQKLQKADEINKDYENEKKIHQQNIDVLNASWGKQLDNLTAVIGELNTRYDELSKKFDVLKKNNTYLKDQFEEKDEENKRLKSKITQKRSECNEESSKNKDLIKRLQEELNSYRNKVKDEAGRFNEQKEPSALATEKDDGHPSVAGSVTPGVNPQAVAAAVDPEESSRQNQKSSTPSDKANQAVGMPPPESGGANNENKISKEASSARAGKEEVRPNIDPPPDPIQVGNADTVDENNNIANPLSSKREPSNNMIDADPYIDEGEKDDDDNAGSDDQAQR